MNEAALDCTSLKFKSNASQNKCLNGMMWLNLAVHSSMACFSITRKMGLKLLLKMNALFVVVYKFQPISSTITFLTE